MLLNKLEFELIYISELLRELRWLGWTDLQVLGCAAAPAPGGFVSRTLFVPLFFPSVTFEGILLDLFFFLY